MRRGRSFALLPWAFAGVGLAFGVSTWVMTERNPDPAGSSPPASAGSEGEIRRLRLALAASTTEAEALRDELDRLLGLYRGSLGARGEPGPSGPGSTETATAEPSSRDLARSVRTYRDALARVAAGEERAADEAYSAIAELIRIGPSAFPALRDAYLSTSDARVRALMVRGFVSTQGREAQEFVASQLRSEKDPDVRLELAERAALMSGPRVAPVFREAFLALARTRDAPELRLTAVRGLRHLGGDEEVEQALMTAASDPAEEVRVAAIENLAVRPALRDALRDLVESEQDPRVRAIGECRLLLAESPLRR